VAGRPGRDLDQAQADSPCGARPAWLISRETPLSSLCCPLVVSHCIRSNMPERGIDVEHRSHSTYRSTSSKDNLHYPPATIRSPRSFGREQALSPLSPLSTSGHCLRCLRSPHSPRSRSRSRRSRDLPHRQLTENVDSAKRQEADSPTPVLVQYLSAERAESSRLNPIQS
jgi:hypothetical protein